MPTKSDNGRPDKVAQQLFVASSQLQALQLNDAPRRLLLNDLVKYIQGVESPHDEHIVAALNTDLQWRKQYLQLLEQLNPGKSPQQAAASSESHSLPTRKTHQFELALKRDKFRPEQVFVLLQVLHPTQTQSVNKVVLNIVATDSIHRLIFPPLADNKTHCILEDSDPLLQALADNAAEVYIMP